MCDETIRVCVLQPFPCSHCTALSWRSCWGCCRSSRKRSPPPPSRWARSAPRCSALQMHAGSPSSAGAMTNVPMATVQTNIIIRLISSAERHLMKKNNNKILHLVWFCLCYSVYFSLMLVLTIKVMWSHCQDWKIINKFIHTDESVLYELPLSDNILYIPV